MASCDSEVKVGAEDVDSNFGGIGNSPGELASNLLLVVGEPFNVEQKDLILERIVTELSSWDAEASKCDINQELSSIEPFKSTALNEGEKIFEHKTHKVKVAVLVNPTLRTTVDKISSFLSLSSTYKYLLYSGPTLLNSGSWLLQDGSLSCQDLCDAFKKASIPDSSTNALLDVSLVSDFTEWNEASLQKSCANLKVRLSRPSKVLTDESGLIKFSDNLSTFLKTSVISERLKSSDVQGSVTFDRPTCYVFPAGQGNSMLFGVEGFNFLIDGGYGRNTCFWDFVRHLNKVDGILMSRLSHDNIFGFSSFFEKKSVDKCGPEVGVVLMNIGDARHKHPVNGSPSRASSGLLVSIAEEGRLLVEHMSLGNLAPPMPCVASNQNHINLYYKVGHGSLDMYTLNPTLDSKDLKDFLGSWSKYVDSYKGGLPLSDAVSVACILIWKPSPHLKENVVRILCPGRVSQQKLLDGFDKLKNLACFHSKSGAEKVVPKKTQSAPSAGGRAALTPTSTRSAVVPKPVKQEAKKVGSATSLEHKANDVTKKQDIKKPAIAKESARKPQHLDHGRAAAKASPQKSPTKITKTAGSKEPRAIKGSAEKRAETKPVPASLDKEEKAQGVEVEGQLSAKESKGQEAKETEDVSSTAVTPSSTEEKPEEAADVKENVGGFEPEKEWGKPEGLPSPMKNSDELTGDQQPLKKAASEGQKSPDKTKKMTGADKVPSKRPATADKTILSSREEPNKLAINAVKKTKGDLTGPKSVAGKPEAKKPLKPVQGFYVDLTYIPTNADPEFFRRVRSQFYVLSSANPDVSILGSLLDGKATWDDTDQWEVSLVPTHESSALNHWLQKNADRLSSASIKVMPPASLCTIQLQDRDSSCAAYRLQL